VHQAAAESTAGKQGEFCEFHREYPWHCWFEDIAARVAIIRRFPFGAAAIAKGTILLQMILIRFYKQTARKPSPLAHGPNSRIGYRRKNRRL
jgi:hypothetical protein